MVPDRTGLDHSSATFQLGGLRQPIQPPNEDNITHLTNRSLEGAQSSLSSTPLSLPHSVLAPWAGHMPVATVPPGSCPQQPGHVGLFLTPLLTLYGNSDVTSSLKAREVPFHVQHLTAGAGQTTSSPGILFPHQHGLYWHHLRSSR